MNINKAALDYWNDESQKYLSPFTKEQISDIETLVSKKLPDDLINFLTQFAGVDLGVGTINDPIAFFVVTVSKGTKFFAGIEADKYTVGIGRFSTFEDMFNVYTTLTGDSPHFDAEARIPDYMLPIDSDGTLYINLSEKNYGEISLWEPIEETWGNEHNNSMDFVAKSFTEFIESLASLDEAEKQLPEKPENQFVGSNTWKNLMKKITGSDDPNVWESFIQKK